jgi:hypothetical protein
METTMFIPKPYDTEHVCFALRARLLLTHWFAKALGLLIKFEGQPLGSNRNMIKQRRANSGSHGSTYAAVGKGVSVER